MDNVKTILLEGKAESGKTTGILFNQVKEMIKKEENLLILDAKAEYYNAFNQQLKEKGYKTFVVNLVDAKESNGYNPLTLPYYYYKQGNMDKAIELVQAIGDEIFKEENPNNDPFWSNSASSLFAGLALLIFKEAKEDEVNIGSISVAINEMNKKDNVVNEYLKKLDVMNPIYIMTSSIAFAPFETRQSILSVASQKIKLYILRENLLNMLSHTDFEIENFGKEKIALFIIARPGHLINTIGNILINQVISVTMDTKIKLNLVLDNIEVIPTINNLKSTLDMLLPNLKIIIATRNIQTLKEMYPVNTFINIMKTVNASDLEKDYYEVKNTETLPQNNYKIKVFDIESHLK